MSGYVEAMRAAASGASGTLVVLSANPIHDTGGGQRSAQLALELLERGFAVVFVSHGAVTETVDLSLRYDHERLVRLPLEALHDESVAGAIEGALRLDPRLVITQVPVRQWLPILERAERAGAATVYDCIDRWDSELGRGWYRASVERDVARRSTVLTASAPALVDHVETLTGRKTALLPNAFNARIFEPDAARGFPRPSDLPSGERVALYVGALWGGWMDWDLVRRSAVEMPGTAFVFVGDHRGEGGRLPDNCHFLGLKPQTDLPAYLAHADVAFIPWVADEVTQATSPLKVYEFVAMELPVVAPAIEPLKGIPGVRTTTDRAAFVRALGALGRTALTHEEHAEIRRFSRASSWGERVDRLLELAAAARADATSPRSGAPAPGTGATLSVVIPAYNHEAYVGTAIDSVLEQTLPAGELVVVDDGSTDGTADVLAGYQGRGIRVVRQENRGAHHALNRAIRLSRGEYVAILNSDDAFEPERLEHAWGVARTTGAALVCGAVRLIDEKGDEADPTHDIAVWYREARAWAERAPSLKAVLRRHNVAVTTSNFFVHRELWARLDGFRAYRYAHDYDFLLRAVQLCPDRVVFEPSLEDVLYRIHGANTISEDIERAAAERRRMMRVVRSLSRRIVGAVLRRRGRRAVRARVDACDTLAPATGLATQPATGLASGPAAAPATVPATGPPAPHRHGRSPRAHAGHTLRVGLVVDSLGTGGLEEIVALLAQSLPAAGVETCVLCARAGGAVADRLTRAGVPVDVLAGRLDRAPAWAERRGVRVVSSHFAPPELVAILSGAGVPVVETVHNTYAWFGEEEWAAERRRLETLRATTAVSQTAAAYYREHTGHAPAWIVPNAVQPGRVARTPRTFARHRLGVAPDRPLFVFVGRITEQKNPYGLLAAFERACERVPDAVLVLAGPVDQSVPVRKLRSRHRALFRRGAVRHLPDAPHIGTVLSAADVFVSNSFYEGWSVAASEATWAGLPLVLSETGGSAALIGEESARGILVPNPCGAPLAVTRTTIARPPEDAARLNEEALAEALIAMSGQREAWRDRGDRIRAYARSELAPEVMARRYAEIFRIVTAG